MPSAETGSDQDPPETGAATGARPERVTMTCDPSGAPAGAVPDMKAGVVPASSPWLMMPSVAIGLDNVGAVSTRADAMAC
jgi:hypothetical protein